MKRNILIVGGGIAGMTAAISLSRNGETVTLIDKDPDWKVYGTGISLTGLSIRAFDDLGILDAVRDKGFVSTGVNIRNTAGEIQFQIPVPEHPQPIDCGGGIMRPVLHEILSQSVKQETILLKLGVHPVSLIQTTDKAHVVLSDDSEGDYDLVIGADGIYSWIRETLFPDMTKPQFTGQGCWRVVAPRPSEIDRTEIIVGGPVKLGLNPVNQDQLYLFILEHVPGNPFYAQEIYIQHVQELLAPYGGFIAQVRENLNEDSHINYRPLEWVLTPPPWYKGRVILIGDAAHATTPHMASGAGLSAEDGIALAQELAATDSMEQALDAFVQRRYDRAREVVENSVRIGEMEMSGDTSGQSDMMIGQGLQKLRQPY